MQKRRLVLACSVLGTLGLLTLLPWTGLTGEYHTGGNLICYDCHTMHFSMQHGWSGGPVAVSGQFQSGGDWLGNTGPNKFLLKLPESNLCLSCHDGQTFAPDVLGANTNSYVRQAGALNSVGGAAPYEQWKGHTMNLTATPPGGVSTITLTCGDCHDFHGNSSYRNLKGAITITYTKGEPYASRTKTVDVWLKQWVLGDLAGNYSYDSVRFNERFPTQSAYAAFCQGCHTAFHGLVGDPFTVGGGPSGGFIRHPTAGVDIGAIPDGQHSSIAQYSNRTNRVHVMSNSNTDYLTAPAGSGTFSVADGLTPSCFSCHKAHGNQNPFGLIFMGPTGVVTEEGTTTNYTAGIINLCSQCHVQSN